MARKLLFMLTILFIVLCFAGGGYVMLSGGQANAGYAVIPMVLALACFQGYQTLKKKENKK